MYIKEETADITDNAMNIKLFTRNVGVATIFYNHYPTFLFSSFVI